MPTTDPTSAVSDLLLRLRHEINNPLSALMLNAEMLKEGGHEDSSELIEEIDRAAKRIAAIVRRLEGVRESAPPRGSTKRPPAQPAARRKLAGDRHSGRTILLVDDEESVRTVVTRVLSGMGHTVLEAEHGADAVRLALEYKEDIHLLVSDLYMPGLRGPEIVEQLSAARPDLKVLYISGYGDEDIVRSGVNPSAAFLRKPFTVQELGEAVEKALAQ
jgi:CheY-like chemotaxis protein